MNYDTMQAALSVAKTEEQLQRAIVDEPFNDATSAAAISLGIVVLLVVDRTSDTIRRVALSETELAENTTTVSAIPFHEIQIPLADARNCIALAVRTGLPQATTDWELLFTPALTAEEARLNQASGGIAYSAVYPVPNYREGAALIFSYYTNDVDDSARQEFMKIYAQLVNKRARSL